MLFGKAMSPCARTNSQLLIKGGNKYSLKLGQAR